MNLANLAMENLKKGCKILVVTWGSRGDVQPMIAFTKQLQEAGFEVALQGSKNAKDLAEKYKVRHIEVSCDPDKILASPVVMEMIKTNNFTRLPEIPEWNDNYGIMPEEMRKAMEDFDVLICIAAIWEHAYLVHKKTGKPVIGVMLQPYFPTGDFGPIVMDNEPFRKDPKTNLEKWEERAKFNVTMNFPLINKYCEEWKLPLPTHPLGWLGEFRFVDKIPVIGGFSELAIGGRPSDWPDYVNTAGYFFLESDVKTLDEKIETFLKKKEDEKPVFFSFGSMKFADPKKTLELATAIRKKLGYRVILSAGWMEFADSDIPQDEDFLFIKGAPYDLLFPRCSVIVHHGGAGTTASALLSGVPQVVVAFFTDQPFWAAAMKKIGVGANPLEYQKLEEKDLLENVKLAHDDPGLIKTAAEIGAKIQQEKGASKAVEMVTKLLKDLIPSA